MELDDPENDLCIANWQKSGQGKARIDDANNAVNFEFGNLANQSEHAFASRHDFFKDLQIYPFCLCLWVVLDKLSILGSANGSRGVLSVVHSNAKDDDSLTDNSALQIMTKTNDNIASLGKSIEQHGQSLVHNAKK